MQRECLANASTQAYKQIRNDGMIRSHDDNSAFIHCTKYRPMLNDYFNKAPASNEYHRSACQVRYAQQAMDLRVAASTIRCLREGRVSAKPM